MKNKRILIGVCFIILLLGIFSNRNRINNLLFHVYSSMIKTRTRNADSFWFSHVNIDSLYDVNRYKYFVFMRNSDNIDIDALTVPKDSLLIVIEGDLKEKELERGYNMVNLPESTFDYLLKDGEIMMLCTVDSVVQSASNRYKMRKVQ